MDSWESAIGWPPSRGGYASTAPAAEARSWSWSCPCRPRARVSPPTSSRALRGGALLLAARSLGLAEELEQRRVDLIRVRPADVVRAAFDPHQPHVGDQTGQ